MSGRERRALLKALESTTHPSAFRELVNNVEYSLRQQAHPNFVRHAICNGNRPRVIFARGLGIFLIVAGIVTEILLTLSSAARSWRVLPIILLLLGFSTLVAAWKGMCVVSFLIYIPIISALVLISIYRFCMACITNMCAHGSFSLRMRRLSKSPLENTTQSHR